jgi:hypothetical protein
VLPGIRALNGLVHIRLIAIPIKYRLKGWKIAEKCANDTGIPVSVNITQAYSVKEVYYENN